ncbi:Periplasmic divalent cation tolerance protein cutA [Methylacidimicrobium sp. AP8]|uniref:divalent-cation tolerance protein CutA n=1 Tax=Methylacidimicrobium sp. AP8 TaxID=2730359 RepID=UPI0018C194C7|nr:divalent-cation tolerance protein CutA [Methylacidimicrobium sp. AP8]CAB4243483.1 Periplasmic divalent cation tolerance protein cutA [Methylacidimicrobium sp. AP8]
MKPLLILITVSSEEEGARLASALLEARAASCVNLLPAIRSFYWWQGKREEAAEVLLLVKSAQEQWEKLETVVRRQHSYECPEIVAFSPERVEGRYLAWWEGELGAFSLES